MTVFVLCHIKRFLTYCTALFYEAVNLRGEVWVEMFAMTHWNCFLFGL